LKLGLEKFESPFVLLSNSEIPPPQIRHGIATTARKYDVPTPLYHKGACIDVIGGSVQMTLEKRDGELMIHERNNVPNQHDQLSRFEELAGDQQFNYRNDEHIETAIASQEPIPITWHTVGWRDFLSYANRNLFIQLRAQGIPVDKISRRVKRAVNDDFFQPQIPNDFFPRGKRVDTFSLKNPRVLIAPVVDEYGFSLTACTLAFDTFSHDVLVTSIEKQATVAVEIVEDAKGPLGKIRIIFHIDSEMKNRAKKDIKDRLELGRVLSDVETSHIMTPFSGGLPGMGKRN